MSLINRIYIAVILISFTFLLFRTNAQPGRIVRNVSAFSDSINDSLKNIYTDTIPSVKELISKKSVSAQRPDSLSKDSVLSDTLKKKSSGLQAPIEYTSDDSTVFFGNGMAYMYGKGQINYEDIQLNADRIRMNMDSSTVFANGIVDSLGDHMGDPVFKDKSGQYESTTLHYGFKSKKGFINNIITQQGEGYLTGGHTKKMEGDEFYMTDGKYTTCDDHECPHFYLQLTKAKVIPKKNIVTGPAYLVLLDVPLPLALPFGFFPFTEKYSSGIIMPTFGDEMARGFYLRDGGYYFAISDFIDLALTGEIYTKGSWGINGQSNYLKRYKYSGNFNIGYLTTILGDKGLPDYSKQTNFRLTWSHTQDQKANPNMNFSASVNFTTSGYNRNDLNSYYNSNSFTENTKSSTVSMSYRFPNSPFSLSASTNITQRTKDSTLNVSFPDFTLNMSRIYPFKRKEPVGKERWYEKISMNYTGVFRNSIETKQNLFFKSSLIKDWRNAMQHTIPVQATFNLLKYINVSPSMNFTDRMYTNKILKEWDPLNSTEKSDTIYGFYNVYNFNFSVGAQTKLYGFYKPLPFLGDKIEMIRHVFTPSVSFSAAPDFGKPGFGFWKTYTYTDNNGNLVEKEYSPFSHGIYGTAPRGKSGVVSFNMSNNLEMKVKSDRDTTGVRKISLIENLSAGISYNMAADSMKWSNINSSILIRLTKGFNLQLSATFDTYTYNANGTRINVPRWKAGKGLGRLSSTGSSFSYTLNNDTFKKKEKKPKKEDQETENEEDEFEDDEFSNNPYQNSQTQKTNENSTAEYNENGYLNWKVPWSLSINYSVNYAYSTFNKEKREYDRKMTQNLSFSGNISPTKNWNFNFSTSYDFDRGKIAYMSCGITRDLHCWSMSADFIPVGPYKSYNFTIAVKSSLLSDLKYNKRGNSYDRLKWY